MDERNINPYRFEDVCICCGEPVPEGRMVCTVCEHANFFCTAEKRVPKAHKRLMFKKRKKE